MTNQSAPQSGSTRFIELGGRFFNTEEIREIQPHGYTMNFLTQTSRYRASASILWKDNSSTVVDLKTGFDDAQSALDFAVEVVRNACGAKRGEEKQEEEKRAEEKEEEKKQEKTWGKQEVAPRILPSILLDRKVVVYRDGGSILWSVKNPEQCGYSTVFEDGAFNSPTKGRFFDDQGGSDVTSFIVRP